MKPSSIALPISYLALVAVPFVGSPMYVTFFTDVLIAACLAMSLNLLVGYTGLVSFGHAAYFGLGAYGCGLLTKHLGLPFGVSLLAGGGIAAFAAAVAGYFCVRLSKVYFSMLTLSFSLIFWAICLRWNDLTGGDQGLSGIPYPNLDWLSRLVGREDFGHAQSYYLVTLAVVTVCVAFMWVVVASPFGLMLRAVRENPQRTTFLGMNIRTLQLAVFIFAGAIAGISGSLFAVFNRGVYPDFLYWTKGAEILIMALIGGIGSFWGPALGAAVLLWLHQETTAFTEYWSLMLGVVLLVLTLAMPKGLAGLVERLVGKRETRK